MDKNLNISILLDFYSGLLTPNQVDILDLYYNQDLSLAEIAQSLEITRQGVRDTIKRGEFQLKHLESQLGLLKKFNAINLCIKNIENQVLLIEGTPVSTVAQKAIVQIGENISTIKELI